MKISFVPRRKEKLFWKKISSQKAEMSLITEVSDSDLWPLCECWPVTLGWSRPPSLVKSWAPVQHPERRHQRHSSNTRHTDVITRVSQHALLLTFTMGTYSSGGAGWMRLDISITAFTSPVTFSYTLSLERSRFAVGGGLISWGWI